MSNTITINDVEYNELEPGMMFEQNSNGLVYMIFFTDSPAGGMYDLRCLSTGADIAGRSSKIKDIFNANSNRWKRRMDVTIEDDRE